MKRGMRRIVTVLFGRQSRFNVAKLTCGHIVPAQSDSVQKMGTGFLLCALCAGPRSGQ